jgi:hypothetical protein
MLSWFIVSQILMWLAMVFDFLSLQFKTRKKIYLTLVVSALLISCHYYLLGQMTAWIIVFFSAVRFLTCAFTTNKKYLLIFLLINTLVLIFTFTNISDLLIYIALFIFIVWNFQANDKLMRMEMMIWTSLVLLYNAFIFSPMWVIAEWNFLLSNFIWYYRYYIKKSKN